jgi:hypothetical protein
MTLAPEPLGFRCGGSSPPFARTHSGIFTPHHSSPPSGEPSLLWGRSPTAGTRDESAAPTRGFGDGLSPDHFRRKSTRLVSYYALFKGMAASKPTSQLSEQIHILCCPLSPYSGTLADGLGSYPLAHAHYRTCPVSPGPCNRYSEFAWSRQAVKPPRPCSALPPAHNFRRPYLNMFRREPAISQFDWPFTPIHSSSERFSTHTGPALHSALPELQPGHG